MRRVVFLWGPSGCGKSTIVRALLGSHPLQAGRWTIGEHCASPGSYAGPGPLFGLDTLPPAPALLAGILSRVERDIPAALPIVIDGDRFCEQALIAFDSAAFMRIAVLLAVSPAELERRRALRGSKPIEAWRHTGRLKWLRAMSRRCEASYEFDGELAPELLSEAVRLIAEGRAT